MQRSNTKNNLFTLNKLIPKVSKKGRCEAPSFVILGDSHTEAIYSNKPESAFQQASSARFEPSENSLRTVWEITMND